MAFGLRSPRTVTGMVAHVRDAHHALTPESRRKDGRCPRHRKIRESLFRGAGERIARKGVVSCVGDVEKQGTEIRSARCGRFIGDELHQLAMIEFLAKAAAESLQRHRFRRRGFRFTLAALGQVSRLLHAKARDYQTFIGLPQFDQRRVRGSPISVR